MTVGRRILARLAIGMSELRRSPSAVIESVEGATVAVLNNGKVSAYLVPAETYERMRDELDRQHSAD